MRSPRQWLVRACCAGVVILVSAAGLQGCDDGGGTLGDDCSSSGDCESGYYCVQCSIRSACYFDDLDGDEAYVCRQYGEGTPMSSGGSNNGSSSSATGVCAYFDSSLNRLLCNPRSSAGSCSGKFFSGSSSCSGFSCTSSTSPSSCTLPGHSDGGSPAPNGGSAGSCDASKVWTCSNDVQVVTMCQTACNYSGSQRTQTCSVLSQMMSPKSAGSCCTVC